MKPVGFGRRPGDQRASNVAQFGRGSGASAVKAGASRAGKSRQAAPRAVSSNGALVDRAVAKLKPLVNEKFDPREAAFRPRGEVAGELEELVNTLCKELEFDLSDLDRRDIVTALFNDLIGPTTSRNLDPFAVTPPGKSPSDNSRATIVEAKERIQPLLLEQIDPAAASEISRQELAEQIGELVGELLGQEKLNLNLREQRDLVTMLLNDMMGLGPLEPLLADDSITDIMINGPKQVYVERGGKLELSDVQFRDNTHVMNIATRIVSFVGRRIDESSPLCDARLEDGSRVNIIIPPLAIDGASISIRKFSKQRLTLDVMIRQNNLSKEVGTVLKIAAASRLNILISGGTGSGKTTLLNALSQMVDHGERIVTIEDAAELQLQQPHVVRLETRPANLEGRGEITMRDLVKNALRMRPDRIILGEIRSSEALDMLQAMNTGHDGSMCTVHANRPREALTRIENMVGMAGINLPSKAVRTQIVSAIDLIVQIARMRDGMRRILQVTEVVGMEGDIITTQDLFTYKYEGEDQDGNLLGHFVSTGTRPYFSEKAEYFGLGRALMEVI